MNEDDDDDTVTVRPCVSTSESYCEIKMMDGDDRNYFEDVPCNIKGTRVDRSQSYVSHLRYGCWQTNENEYDQSLLESDDITYDCYSCDLD